MRLEATNLKSNGRYRPSIFQEAAVHLLYISYGDRILLRYRKRLRMKIDWVPKTSLRRSSSGSLRARETGYGFPRRDRGQAATDRWRTVLVQVDQGSAGRKMDLQGDDRPWACSSLVTFQPGSAQRCYR